MEKEQIDRAFKNLEDSNFGDVMVVGGGISGIQASLILPTRVSRFIWLKNPLP